MRYKLLVNCATGQKQYVPLSSDELLEIESREAIEIQNRINEKNKFEQQKLKKNKFVGQKFVDLSPSDRTEFLAVLLEKLNIVDNNGIVTVDF